jgi:ubiquinone/menaquinone biosynthesis C-methylase UbiE
MIGLSNIKQRNIILDAGCGPGIDSKILSLHVNDSSIVYSCDFSTEMINLCKKEFFEYSDFNSNKENYWSIVDFPSNEQVSVEEDNSIIRNSHKGKIFKFFDCNVEKIPFLNSQFDMYISSLCILYCQNADNAINEAFRLIKSDGIALFSVWGDKSKSKHFSDYFGRVFSKYNISMGNKKSGYSLSENVLELKERFTKAGFKKVLLEYTNVMYSCFTPEDYVSKFYTSTMRSILEGHSSDKSFQEKVLDEVKALVKEEMTLKDEVPILNCLIIAAFK